MSGTGLQQNTEVFESGYVDDLNVSNTIYYQGSLLDPLLASKVDALETDVSNMKGTGWTTANTIKGNSDNITTNIDQIASMKGTGWNSTYTIKGNADAIAGKLNKSGDTMTGALTMDVGNYIGRITTTDYGLSLQTDNGSGGSINEKIRIGDNYINLYQPIYNNYDIVMNVDDKGIEFNDGTNPRKLLKFNTTSRNLEFDGEAIGNSPFEYTGSVINNKSDYDKLKLDNATLELDNDSLTTTPLQISYNNQGFNTIFDGSTYLRYESGDNMYFLTQNTYSRYGFKFAIDSDTYKNNRSYIKPIDSFANDLEIKVGDTTSGASSVDDYKLRITATNTSNTTYTLCDFLGKDELIEVFKPIKFNNSVPSTTTLKLYSDGTKLYWNGTELATGNSTNFIPKNFTSTQSITQNSYLINFDGEVSVDGAIVFDTNQNSIIPTNKLYRAFDKLYWEGAFLLQPDDLDTMNFEIGFENNNGIDWTSANGSSNTSKRLYRATGTNFDNLFYDGKMIPHMTSDSTQNYLTLPATGGATNNYIATFNPLQNNGFLMRIQAWQGLEIMFNQNFTLAKLMLEVVGDQTKYDLIPATWNSNSQIILGAYARSKYIEFHQNNGTTIYDDSKITLNANNDTRAFVNSSGFRVIQKTIMSSNTQAGGQIGNLRYSGVQIDADDFGTARRWNMSVYTGNYLVFNHLGGTNNDGYISPTSANSQMNFTGMHRNHVIESDYSKLKIGMILCSTGKIENCLVEPVNAPTIDEALPILRLSNKKKEKCVFGVYSGNKNVNNHQIGCFGTPLNFKSKKKFSWVNGSGEGAILVNKENGIIENGDFIMTSSKVGIGCKSDNVCFTNYTIAKATQNLSDGIMNADGTYLISCLYML